MLNLLDPRLISIYGSWIRVQVAFYDFLFESSMEYDAETLTKVSREVMESGLVDGEGLYEEFVKKIASRFESPQQAWDEFVSYSLSNISIKPLPKNAG